MTTTRISIDSNGNEGNNNALNPVISADGRYVAFDSDATNLIPNDTNEDIDDIFVRDRQTDTTRLISLSNGGIQGNNASLDPSISADGRYIAFQSVASNLVTGDTNATSDIFVRDLQTNSISRVNLSSSGIQANNYSNNPSISADGRFVAFYSEASNLVSNDTNGEPDIFVRDLQNNTTQRVSIDSNGIQGNSGSFQQPEISADGRYVIFESDATNLVPNDTNNARDIFVRDLQNNTTRCVSVNSNGVLGNGSSFFPAVSADGRYAVFESDADNLVPNDTNNGIGGDINDIFIHDLQTGATRLVSLSSDGTQGNSNSFSASISSDGRYVAFTSTASNLVPNDNNRAGDVFLRDLQTNITSLISVDSNGVQGENASSIDPAISADGRFIAFNSFASNLVPDDRNESRDIFVAETGRSPVADFTNLDADGSGGQPNFSRDGLLIAAFLFFYQNDRTDYSVLDRFILAPDATRKTGNDIADYLKDGLKLLDADGSGGQPSFSRDGLLIAAFLFFYQSDRTDYSVLDRFILAPDATRKTGNEVANYLKGFIDDISNSSEYISSGDILGHSGNTPLAGDFSQDRDAGDDLLTSVISANYFFLGDNNDLETIDDFNIAAELIPIDSSMGFTDSAAILSSTFDGEIKDDCFAAEFDRPYGISCSLAIDHHSF
jgi:Tol biopolymer transport system component